MSEFDLSPQEEELEALRSIYDTDWEDLPPQKTAWNIKGEDGWWAVRLKGADERVSVKLKGRFTKLYPKAVPILSIEEAVGLTPGHVHTLNKIVNDKAKFFSSRKDPAPYIFDINDSVIEWISTNHVPLPKLGEKIPTLMEEMAQREEAQRVAEVAKSQSQKEQQRAQAEKQNRLLNEQIQMDASRKAQKASQAVQDEALRKRQETLASLLDGELEMRELVLDSPISIDGYDGQYSNWMLFGGRRQSLWTTYSAEPDGGNIGFVKASLPCIAAQVVDFSTPYYSTAQGKKRVDAVAVEINRLREVKCENVVAVYGVQRDKSPKGWERLIILTEKVEGGKLKDWLPREGFGEVLSREYITQLLSGLAGIHRIGATQKQIDSKSTFLAPRSAGDLVAKLGGTGYARRIIDLHRSNPFLRAHEEVIPDSWLSPDEVDSPYTYTSKRDIWHMGVLLVQLLFGYQSLWLYPSLSVLLQHTPGVSDGMIEILNGLLHHNSKKRFTAEEALIRARAVDEVTRRVNKDAAGPVHFAPSTHSPHTHFGTSPVSGTNYFPQVPLYAPRSSRYREDFEEVEFLGKGGFGEVVKARNKIDGRAYAIKKVKLRPEDNEAKVYREVNNLSRVSHQYIVRYHACWIEDQNQQPPTPSESDVTTPTPTASISEEPSDPFAINFDDISRRDQSRSASFPRIRFANGDDSDEEDTSDSDSDADSDSTSSDETAADPSELRGRGMFARQSMAIQARPSGSAATGTTMDEGAVQSILYIQMEFVEKQTLREAITAGLDEEEVWRLLGQILQALAHMSSLGIVHRDLKPSNILLDASGNVKIADFGLSTTEMTAVEVAAAPNGEIDYTDRTSGIGTSLYIAPEVAISRSYNEKADMYSLGVIFFEMCFAFKTNMERVYILNAIRQPSITFPPAWPADVKPNQREIVEWLLRHDPAMRPRAEQLLASPLLPAREKQKEFYDAAIAELSNPRSDYHTSLLEALFDPQTHMHTSLENRIDDFTFDNDDTDLYDLQVWLTVVVQRLVDLLQRHGAVETYLPLLIPETLLLEAFPDLTPVRLLDCNGKVVQLPSSDLLAMARSATRRQIERIKRYHVGHKYSDHAAGGQPKTTGELTYDIISPIRSYVAEAELLDVMDKVISEFRGIKGSSVTEYEFHISHETILACIINSVPEKARSNVRRALKSISSDAVGSTKLLFNGLAGVSKQVQDELEQCCIADDFHIVRQKLEALLPGSKRKMASAFDALATIIGLARACGITRKIVFRPSLSRNAEFFRGGFMFECVRRGKQRELIAFGGRYDSLLEHFKAPSQNRSRKVHGVGMSINTEQLAKMVRKTESAISHRLMEVERIEDRSFGYWSPARCDVYVANVSQVDLKDRLSIVAELWRAGIKADLQYDDERTIETIETECLEQNTLFIVIPRHSRDGLRVKVKNVLKGGKETEHARPELCAELKQAISEQRRIDASHAEARGSVLLAQSNLASAFPGAAGEVGKVGKEADVRLVLPLEPWKDKSKKGEKKKIERSFLKGSKNMFTDKATEFGQSTGTCLPILACDLSSQLLSQLTLDTSWLADDDAWRTVQANHFGEERKYLDIVRENVREGVRNRGWAGTLGASAGSGGGAGTGGKGWIWLFSVREGRGFLLQPSK